MDSSGAADGTQSTGSEPIGRDPLQAAEHLYYEVEMLVATTHRLQIISDDPDPAVLNALLESFTIHARALIGFLWADNAHKDDVLAQHYFDDPQQWKALCPPIPDVLAAVRTRVGKEIVHITYSRNFVADDAKWWDHSAIAQAVREVFEIFKSNVPYHNVSQPFDPFMKADMLASRHKP